MNEAEQVMARLRELPPESPVQVSAGWMIELLSALDDLTQRMTKLEQGLSRTNQDLLLGGPRF